MFHIIADHLLTTSVALDPIYHLAFRFTGNELAVFSWHSIFMSPFLCLLFSYNYCIVVNLYWILIQHTDDFVTRFYVVGTAP